MKIVGIVFAKNEWGLIVVSISHALINHVDEVYVVNHASTDQTFNGLNHLKKLWGERLHIITINNIGFFQEEATNTIIQISKKSNPDWIYVFDADEFLLADESTSLKKYCQIQKNVAKQSDTQSTTISQQDILMTSYSTTTKILFINPSSIQI
jgi:hypothetical protein